ncbi:MAG: fused DSP-PTPase phosphatase/NAD kinase-like protein [Hyphomicrobiaceae bacterium]
MTLPFRRALIDKSPDWIKRSLGPAACYFDMLFVDHGLVRLIYPNRHRLDERAWRSAQPAPHEIEALARQGVRTIVNLRGERQCGSYWLEREACARHGIDLIDFQIRSRAAPTRQEVHAARDLFERIGYPMLMHCKSGADRVGLMSTLYCFLRSGTPLEQAKRQLSLRYGHIRQADTGILDRFFERYLEDTRTAPMAFFEWLDTVYDADELQRSFRAGSWANRLVNGVLRRE